MEALTPLQRIAVITIGLVLTIIIAMLVLPWISKQINERLELAQEATPAAMASPRAADAPTIRSRPTWTTGCFTWLYRSKA